MNFFNHNNRGHFQSDHSSSSMKKVSYKLTLKSKKQIAHGTYAFFFEKPKEFNFNAGQHVRMTLINPPDTDSEGNSRFFSFASSPQEQELLFAMRMRDTAFKKVLGAMQKGDKVLIEMLLHSPPGSLALHKDVSKPAIFLIGGIGIVPAFSMINDAIEKKLGHKIFLFYSNRRPVDAPFLEELQNLTKQNPSFKLIATMTQSERQTKLWQGETGKINRSMLKKYLGNLESPIYYIAGLPKMVSAMRKMLIDIGINEDNMRSEEFTGFNLNEMHNTTNHNGKRHLIFIALGSVILVMVALHVFAATSLLESGIGVSFLKNPIFYFMIILMLIIVPLKLKHLLSFIQKRRNHYDYR